MYILHTVFPSYDLDNVIQACRFLFLSPAVESVETELGTLLLDSRLQGQLYVRQVWVSDQTKDGLAVGVNFKKSVQHVVIVSVVDLNSHHGK